MRQEELKNRNDFDLVDISAHHGPPPPALVQMDSPRARLAEVAVPDVPRAVGISMAAVYAAIVGLFALTIANAGEAPFMIAIDVIFLIAFFGVPTIFLTVERASVRPSMSRFMAEGMQTYTGHVSGGGALAQMFVVPVLLALAVVAFGIIAATA